MERLTELHFKKTDGFYMKCSEHCYKEDFSCEDCEEFEKLVDRLGAIEGILGDEYDLDRLRELAQADKEGRCVVLPTKDDIMNTRCCVSCIHFQNLDWCGECVGNSKWEPCKAALRREQDG